MIANHHGHHDDVCGAPHLDSSISSISISSILQKWKLVLRADRDPSELF